MSEREPTVQVYTPRPRGRPRVVGEGGFALSTWVSDEDARQLYALAKRYECSVSEVIRRVVRVHFPTE